MRDILRASDVAASGDPRVGPDNDVSAELVNPQHTNNVVACLLYFAML